MRLTQFFAITEEDYGKLPERGFHLGAGVLIYCPDTGRALLQKRGPRVEDPGQYDYFGGGVDDGENVLQGAIRELEEEGGITAKESELYPLAVFGKDMSLKLGGYHIFLMLVDKEFEPALNYDADAHDEVAGAEWLGREDYEGSNIHKRVTTLMNNSGLEEAVQNAARTLQGVSQADSGYQVQSETCGCQKP